MQCTLPPPTSAVEITATIDASHNVTVSGNNVVNGEIDLRALGCKVPLKFTIASSVPGHTFTFSQDAVWFSNDKNGTNKNVIDNSSNNPQFNDDISRSQNNSVLTFTYNNLGSYCSSAHKWGNLGFVLSDNGGPSFNVDPIIDNGSNSGLFGPKYCVTVQHRHHHHHR